MLPTSCYALLLTFVTATLSSISAAHSHAADLKFSNNVEKAEASSSRHLVEKALSALGGRSALANIVGLTYEVPNIYRAQSLMQSYNMLKADVYIAVDGVQNISFSYSPGSLQHRIDRRFTQSEYWYFATPNLDPVEFSLVIQQSNNSFASYVRGSNDVFGDPSEAAGYQDNGLVEYLVHQANVLSPKLLETIAANRAYSSTLVEIQPGVLLPAVHEPILNLTVLFDPETHLPYIIRTYEDHYVYGPSTRDLQLTEYAEVNGVMFPHRFMTIYNNESVIEDFLVEHIQINPRFGADFFSGEPIDGHGSQTPTPVDPEEYSQSEIGEFYDNMLWNGAYTGTFDKIIATHPIRAMPQLWHLMFPDAPNYENLVLDFEDGVMVLDAPPHQSDLIIEWIRRNIKKPITHIWPTHHHHDHSGGISQFVALGATLVVPVIAQEYWSISTPNATVITYDDARPYIYSDRRMQVRFLWEQQAVHAVDWSYAMVTSACPGPNDGIIAFEADAWSPGTDATRFDVNFARQWLRQAERDGLSADARVVAVHGRNRPLGSPLRDLINVTGYKYPEFNTTSWKTGGTICVT